MPWLMMGLGAVIFGLLGLCAWLWLRLRSGSSTVVDETLLIEMIGYLPHACVVVSQVGRILAMNKAAVELFGDNPTGEAVAQLLGALQLSDLEDAGQHRTALQRRDGAAFQALVTAQPLPDGAAIVLGFQQLPDDTPLQQALAAQRQRADELAALLEQLPIALMRAAADGRIVWSNRAMMALCGYSLNELQGRPLDAMIFEDVPDTLERHTLQRALREKQAVSFETVRYHRQGDSYWVRVDACPLDAIGGVLVAEQPITPYKAQLERVVAERDFAQAVLEAVQHGLVALDNAWHISYANPAAAALLGVTPEALTQQSAATTELAGLRDLLSAIENAARNDASEFEMALAQDVTLRVTVVPQSSDGKQSRIAVLTDISARKQIEQELIAAKEAAEQATRIQRDFLSRMSHELRTPLNAILGFAQLLQLDTLSAEQHVAVERILSSGRHLLTLINEVLDLTRIELWGVSLASEPVMVPELVEAALELLVPQISARQLSVHHDRTFTPPRVYGDASRLKQVLINLLSNAVKYNRDQGTITVRYTRFSHQVLRIAISDSGLGIAADKLHRLFTPFDRLDMEHSGIEGSGVGLSLSQRLIESMGGEIGVESAIDQGSTFWVDLPCEPMVAAAPTTPHLQTSEPLKTVLYLDEYLSQLELLDSLARRIGGIRVISAVQGSLGLMLIRQEQPALVVLERLPAMSALQFVAQVTQLAQPPALLALVAPHDTEAERLTSVCQVLYKPLDVKALAAILTALKGEGASVQLPARHDQQLLVNPAEAAEVLRRTKRLLKRFNPEPSQRMHYELLSESVDKHLADLVATNTLLWQRREALEHSNLEMLERLSHIAEFRDDKTGLHTKRIGQYAAKIGAKLGFDEGYANMLSRAAQLHDIGKIGIADTILLKPGRLTPEEQQVVRTHSTIGATLLSGGTTPLLTTGQVIAESHHENWDGSGYPYNLSGDDIPIAGRIVAVADVYDTLTHERPYKKAWREQEALEYLLTERNQKFDAEVVDAFVAVLREG
jgi:PAS domain S-box-containing protein